MSSFKIIGLRILEIFKAYDSHLGQVVLKMLLIKIKGSYMYTILALIGQAVSDKNMLI